VSLLSPCSGVVNSAARRSYHLSYPLVRLAVCGYRRTLFRRSPGMHCWRVETEQEGQRKDYDGRHSPLIATSPGGAAAFILDS
jgi:hypothetical protein